MKVFCLVLVFLFAGYLLGGWKPGAELKRTQDELETIRKELKDRAKRGRSPIQGVTRMLEIPDADYKAKPNKQKQDEEGEGVEVEGAASNQVAKAKGDRPRPFRPFRRRGEKDDGKTFEERIELAVDAWSLRSELAKEAFVEKSEFNDEESLQFNTLMSAMNLRIEGAITEWADRIENDGIQGEEIGIRIMSDITAAMALTYDEMDRTLPEGWRENSGDSFKLSSQIDPRVALPLAGVEDKLNFR